MDVGRPDLGAVGESDADDVSRMTGDESRGNDLTFAFGDRRTGPDRNDLRRLASTVIAEISDSWDTERAYLKTEAK